MLPGSVPRRRRAGWRMRRLVITPTAGPSGVPSLQVEMPVKAGVLGAGAQPGGYWTQMWPGALGWPPSCQIRVAFSVSRYIPLQLRVCL